MQKSKLQFKIKNFLIASVLFFIATPGFAAEVNVVPLNWEVGVGQELEINVSFSAEGEPINAISGEVVFPQEILELEKIKDGNSIVSLWVEKPRQKGNAIVFAGIIPGGFNKENGLLFSLVFKTKKEGNGVIELRNMESFYNDGKGTPAPLKLFQLAFAVKKEGVVAQPPLKEDREPPESFVPEIGRDDSLFDGKWFLVFATQDKGSGISGYEVKETRWRIFRFLSRWVPAESPYVLRDQNLQSYIYIRAVDKSGNARIVTLSPRYSLPWYESPFLWGIIILIAVSTGFVLWKKKKQNHSL